MSLDDNAIARPLPELAGFAGDFYGYCKSGELRFQRCLDCSSWRHVPREMCADCGSWNWEWARSSGRGKIFSWTVVTRALHPAFQDACPYAPVIIEMEEGVRLLSELTDCPPDELAIDQTVEVVFEDVSENVTLPKFRRVAS
ncbi:MAG: DNA-binding protein [Deltaproteobacteria bacterium]|nr:DNA-binding protein [Deltaproteobacteria bacterium]